MHVYIYDSFLNQKKYDSALAKTETRITDLGLNGKISRLGVIKNVRETIENEIKRGAKTIIAVGNDHIVNEAVNVLAGKRLPLGIIPINDGPNEIAKSLGIGFAEKACDTLSARRIEKLDVIAVNNHYFLSEASIPSDGSIIEISQDYSIETDRGGEIKIINFPALTKGLPDNMRFNPQDGIFELYIKTKEGSRLLGRPKKSGYSFFSLKSLTISNSKKHPVLIDGVKEILTPAEIRLSEKSLDIIVGKDRAF